jgi:heterodisulfide reductase subunit C
MTELLLKSDTIWLCADCLKCKERCPREVAPCDVIQALRNNAFKSGLTFPVGYSQNLRAIFKNGLVQQSQSVRTRKGERVNRKSLDLPKLQKPHSMERIAENLNKILNFRGEKV